MTPERAAAAAGRVAAAALCAALLLATAAAAQGDVAVAAPETGIGASLEAFAKGLTLNLARFAEVAAAVVIGVASLRALAAYLGNVARPRGGHVPRDEIRLSLGRSLALALEFSLGADILKTAVAPTWNEIGQLAAIAVLRTALNFFLERELEHARDRMASGADAPA